MKKISLENFTDLVFDYYSRGYINEDNITEEQEEIIAQASEDFKITEEYKSELKNLDDDEIPEVVLKVIKPDERWFDENDEDWEGFDPEETLKDVVISFIRDSRYPYLWDSLTDSQQDLIRDLSEEVEKAFYDYEESRDFYYDESYEAIESWYKDFLKASD